MARHEQLYLIEMEFSEREAVAVLEAGEKIAQAIDDVAPDAMRLRAAAVGVAVAAFVEASLATAPEGHREEARRLLEAGVHVGQQFALAMQRRQLQEQAAREARTVVTQALADARKP